MKKKGIVFFVFSLLIMRGHAQIPCDSLYSKATLFNYKVQAFVGIPPETLEVGMILVPTMIIYDLGKPGILSQYRDSLRLWAEIIRKSPDKVFEIAVHSDSRGSDILNTNLTARRAASVYECLHNTYKTDSCALRYKGYGESQLLVDDNTIKKAKSKEELELLHKRNRRTELRVIGYKK